jgi:glycosyltransferase involved in cell wall biosynthesis
MVTISAIVPATNGPPTLEACIDAIRAADDGPDEVIVVTDPTLEGPAAARNAGARKATGNVLVFVDADVVVHRDAFKRIRRAFAAEAGLTAVFGSYDVTPSAPGVVTVFRNLLHHYVHQSSGGPATTFWAGLGAVRREPFLEVGGFDERYRVPSIEDVELGMRLADGGALIVLEPEVQGTHLKAWSLREMLYTDFIRRGVPWVRLLLERGSPSRALNLGWRHRLSAASAVAAPLGFATGHARFGTGAGAAFVVLNGSFYALLFKRRGGAQAAVGIGLHVLHHLTAVASVPVGIAAHTLSSRRPPALTSRLSQTRRER